MAYKIILTNRCSTKLVAILAYAEKSFSPQLTRNLIEKIDKTIMFLSHQSAPGVASNKIAGVYKISISRNNKLYYQVKGRKIILLDLLTTNTISGPVGATELNSTSTSH